MFLLISSFFTSILTVLMEKFFTSFLVYFHFWASREVWINGLKSSFSMCMVEEGLMVCFGAFCQCHVSLHNWAVVLVQRWCHYACYMAGGCVWLWNDPFGEFAG